MNINQLKEDDQEEKVKKQDEDISYKDENLEEGIVNSSVDQDISENSSIVGKANMESAYESDGDKDDEPSGYELGNSCPFFIQTTLSPLGVNELCQSSASALKNW